MNDWIDREWFEQLVGGWTSNPAHFKSCSVQRRGAKMKGALSPAPVAPHEFNLVVPLVVPTRR